ncbi:hypothetical protein A2U01_0057076, partial [Trifolium medium]|nr:hypothetical protein [Trifolium medium]
MTVSEYAAKFEDLCRFAPHYNTMEAEEDKCVKFENGLRPEIKQLIGFNEIRNFPTLVNKSRICDKDSRASEKRGREMGRGKSYGRGGRRPEEGGSSGGRG